jgi:hypothetical protein
VFTCECVILAAGATLLSALFAMLALPVLATAVAPIYLAPESVGFQKHEGNHALSWWKGKDA